MSRILAWYQYAHSASFVKRKNSVLAGEIKCPSYPPGKHQPKEQLRRKQRLLIYFIYLGIYELVRNV